uniref:Thioredoxin domain-containing protein n=1 Tax=viral metagenome TaxID=1070528 RepID=A0A6C0CJB4_9ZZZZ
MEDETPDLFERDRVQELESEDFALTSVDGLALNREGCSIVLFYDDSDESTNMHEIWIDLSEEFSGINFGAVNTTRRRSIMKRIMQIQNSPNHPLWRYFNRMSYPAILAFREVEPGLGFPQAVYNGPKSYEDLADWVANSACQEGYNEYPPEEGNEDDLVNAPSSTNQTKQNARVRRVLADRERELDILSQNPDQYKDMPEVVSIPNYGRARRSKQTADTSFYNF